MHDPDSFGRMSDAGLTDRQPSLAEFLTALERIDVARDTDTIFRSARS